MILKDALVERILNRKPVLFRIPKPTPNQQIFPESVRYQNLGFFTAVSDGIGSSVRKTIFSTYQVAVFKLCRLIGSHHCQEQIVELRK